MKSLITLIVLLFTSSSFAYRVRNNININHKNILSQACKQSPNLNTEKDIKIASEICDCVVDNFVNKLMLSQQTIADEMYSNALSYYSKVYKAEDSYGDDNLTIETLIDLEVFCYRKLKNPSDQEATYTHQSPEQ